MSEPPVLADQKDNTLNMHERSSIGLSKGTKRGPPGLPEWTARPGGWAREGEGKAERRGEERGREWRGCPQTRVYRGVPPLPLA